MKYLIEKNIVRPVEKVTDEIKERSIEYTGYTNEGEEISIYDLENGKLAPIVRYLIEGGGEKTSKLMIWLIIGGLVSLLGIIIYAFSGEEEVKEIVKENPVIKETIEAPSIIKENIQTEKIDNTENELRNEVDMMTGLKNEAELQTLRNTFEIEKKNIEIQKLQVNNSDLIEKNSILEQNIKNLENNLKNQVNRIIESPKDAFIYYLGDNVYQRCENASSEEIIDNCKDLYYKYTKYDKNK